jgi:hypothetical protein
MTTTNQPDWSPAPGIIPETVHVHDDNAPTAATAQRGKPTPRRRNPVRLVAPKVMGALRGDKYMVDTYPAAERDDAGRAGQASWSCQANRAGATPVARAGSRNGLAHSKASPVLESSASYSPVHQALRDEADDGSHSQETQRIGLASNAGSMRARGSTATSTRPRRSR